MSTEMKMLREKVAQMTAASKHKTGMMLDLQNRVADAESSARTLYDALVALRREKSSAYPRGCWCEAMTGNPMVTSCGASCKLAQDATVAFEHGKRKAKEEAS